MTLITVERFIEVAFEEGSRPDPRTVRAWIDSAAVRGRKIRPRGKKRASYYVDLDAWRQAAEAVEPAAAVEPVQ